TIQGDGPGPEIPAAPTLSSAVPGDRSVSLSWSRVDNADGYKVKYGTRSGNYTEEIEVGNRTSYTVSGLTNGTRYYFAVVAYNAAGESRNSNELSATPETGSGPITGQIELELSQNTETTTNTINPTFRIKNIGSSFISLSDLEIRYYYTIDGEQLQNFWCDHAAIVSPSYSPITSSVTGSFTKMPESTSGADYYLSVKFTGNNTLAAGAIAEIQTRFAKNNWTNYNQSNDFSFNDASKVAVFLRGELIWGSTPDGTGPVEPEVPAAPVLSSAVPGDGSVSLSWSRVDNADGYRVKYGTRSGNYTEEIEVGNRTSYTVSGLTNGTRYYFAVVAYNAAGESRNSNELSATPVKEVTEGLTISIGTAKAARGETVTIPVRFEDVPPAGINNADFIIGYDTDVVEAVSVNAGEIVPRPNIDFYHAIHNDRGQVNFLFADEEQMQNYLIHDSGVFAYIEFKVLSDAPLGFTEIFVKSVGAIADYDLNVYEVATESGGITVEDSDIIVAPDAPVLLNAVPGIESVTLEWSRVDNADGYKVKYGTVSGAYTEEIDVASTTAYTVSGLTGNLRYYFVVSAYNAAGESANSNQLSAVPEEDDQITGFTIAVGTVSAEEGETITVPIRLVNVPAAGINNADFIIGYDRNALEAVSVSAGEIVPRPNIDFYHAIHNDRGQVNFLFADEEQMRNYLIYDDGVFAYIEFKVLPGAPTGLSKVYVKSIGAIADYDLNVYDVDTRDGGVNIN
ncbi:MAG: cohesin domain-containing protein, partial [Halanaerobiales bacterium]